MTRIRVGMNGNRNIFVMNVYAPRSRRTVAVRRRSKKPFAPIEPGMIIRASHRRLCVTAVVTRVSEKENVVEQIIDVFTRAAPRKRARRPRMPQNVVPMPGGDCSMVAQFLRYHVLVRVFDGDPDAWLARLQTHDGNDGDLRFVRWIRSRLRQDPALLTSIRAMVDATPFWRAG